MSHTPGPWTVGRARQEWVIAPESGGDVIARIAAHDLDFTRRKGNGHLIAAAPDLLAACEYALQFSDDDHVRLILKAAIGKAKGETP